MNVTIVTYVTTVAPKMRRRSEQQTSRKAVAIQPLLYVPLVIMELLPYVVFFFQIHHST